MNIPFGTFSGPESSAARKWEPHTVDPQRRLIELLITVPQELGPYFRDYFKRSDVPLLQMMILWSVHAKPGQTVSELARTIEISKSYVSNSLADLERLGWVRREADPEDQRLVRAVTTEAYQTYCDQMEEGLHRHIGRITEKIPKEAIDTVVAGLELALKAVQAVKREEHT